MSRLFIILFLLTSSAALAQAVVPGIDLQVSHDSEDAANVEIAVSSDGTYLVAHDSTAHFYDGDMSVIGNVVSPARHIFYPFIIHETNFAFLGSSGQPCSGPTGYRGTSRFYALHGNSESEFTDVVYNWSDCTGINGEYNFELPYSRATHVAGDYYIFCINSFSGSDLSGNVYNNGFVDAINRSTGQLSTIKELNRTEFTGWPSPSMPPPPKLLSLARGANGEFGVLSDNRDSKNFQIFDATADRVGDDVVIESNITNPEFRFEVPVLTANRILLLHRYHNSDSVRADIYDRNGTPVIKGLSLGISTDTTRSHKKTEADSYFFADVTDNNNVVVLWEGRESNGDVNLYVRLFTEDGTPLSITKRVNTDTAGIQRSSKIETRGDTVYAAWISDNIRPELDKAFTKVFSTGDVTPVTPMQTVSGFTIDAMYPQPAHGSITIGHTLPAFTTDAEIILYNLLGKELLRCPALGNQTTIELPNLPSGVYRAVIRDGKQSVQQLFNVTR